jgi:hypothetical protein
MALKSYYQLSNDREEAQSVLKSCLDELDWGIVVSLGPGGKPGFDLAATFTGGNSQVKVTAVWAEDATMIADLINGLQNGGAVNFGPNGHRMVSINKRDQVSRCLSRLESESPIDVIGAIWCAARSDRACDY